MQNEQRESQNQEEMAEDGWTYKTYPPFEGEKFIFRHVDENEEVSKFSDLSEYLKVTTRVFYIGTPTHENRHFIPRRLFGRFMSRWDGHGEEVVSIESVSKEEMEEELEDFEYREPLEYE